MLLVIFMGVTIAWRKLSDMWLMFYFHSNFNAERQCLLWYMSTKYLLKDQSDGGPFFFVLFGILSQVSETGRSLHEDPRIHWIIYWKAREIPSEIAQEMQGKQERWSTMSWEVLSHFHNFLHGVSIRKVLGVNPCTYMPFKLSVIIAV